MKYRVVSWEYKTGNHSLTFCDSIIELEPIEDLSDVLEEKDFDIDSFIRPLPPFDKSKPTYKVDDKVRVVGEKYSEQTVGQHRNTGNIGDAKTKNTPKIIANDAVPNLSSIKRS